MPTYYDFFCGGGMVNAGLGDDWECIFANDIDEKKLQVYRKNWGNNHLVPGDVNDVTCDQLPGIADLAWASFPCQDLSLAGKYQGLMGKRSGTFWPFWKLIEDLKYEDRQPRIIVLENVAGAITSNRFTDFAAIVEAFVEEGYRCGALVINAKHFVPQSRPRLFIIGVKENLYIPKIIFKEYPQKKWHTSTLIKAYYQLNPIMKKHWIWWHLPLPNNTPTPLLEILELESKYVKWNTIEKTNCLLGLMDDSNLKKIQMAKNANSIKVGTLYRRTRPNGNGGKIQRAEVRFDDIAGCLRTPAGGSSRQTIVVVNGETIKTRLLTPRETARLMGLDDSFHLPKRYNEAYHLTGDGVVAPVVEHLKNFIFEPIFIANQVRAVYS